MNYNVMRAVYLLSRRINAVSLRHSPLALLWGVAAPLCFIPPPLCLLTHYQIHSSCLNNMVLNLRLMLGM